MSGVSGANEAVHEQPKSTHTKERSNKCIFLAVIFLTILLVIGESIFTVLKYRGLHHITTVDGLATDEVGSMAIGPDGDIWVGGHGGLSRISGDRISNIPLPDGMGDRSLSWFQIAPNGDVWVMLYEKDPSSFQDVYHFNGQDWVQYPEMFDFEDGIYLEGIAANDEIWFDSEDGLIRYDGQEWQFKTLSDWPFGSASDIRFAASGDIWAGVLGPDGLSGQAHFDGESWEFFDIEDYPFFRNRFFVTADGDYWGIGEGYQNVVHYDGREWSTLKMEDDRLYGGLKAIAPGPDGMIWIGNWEGIARYDGEEWRKIVPLSSGFWIDQLVVDDQNNLWFTTDDRSFLPIDNAGIRMYDTARMVVPVWVIDKRRQMRIALLVAIFALLLIAGQRKSLIAVKDRLRTATILTLITNAIILPVMIVIFLYLSGGEPAWFIVFFIAIIITLFAAAGGLLVGYSQRDSVRLTRTATIILAVAGWAITLLSITLLS